MAPMQTSQMLNVTTLCRKLAEVFEPAEKRRKPSDVSCHFLQRWNRIIWSTFVAHRIMVVRVPWKTGEELEPRLFLLASCTKSYNYVWTSLHIMSLGFAKWHHFVFLAKNCGSLGRSSGADNQSSSLRVDCAESCSMFLFYLPFRRR